MKVAIIGSRGLQVAHLGTYLPDGVTEIVSGGAKGIDTCARVYAQSHQIIAIFKNKANSRRNGTSLSSQKAKLSEKHIVSRSEEHPASSP